MSREASSGPIARIWHKCCRPFGAAVCFAIVPAVCPAASGPALSALAPASLSEAQLASYVDEAAARFGIPAAWIWAVLRAESAGDVLALSSAGAIGLMQIMPDTWADLRVRYGLGADPYQPHDNVLAGAAYLRELHDRYGAPGFLAAYNAGPARWKAHLSRGQLLPEETRLYVARLLPWISDGNGESAGVYNAEAQARAEPSLFPARPLNTFIAANGALNMRPIDGSAASRNALAPQGAGLFAAISRVQAVR